MGFAQVRSICSLSGLRPSENPPQGAREQETCPSELVSGSHNSNDNAIAGHPSSQARTARNDEEKSFNSSTVQPLNHSSIKKCAFTLAEVLITLGIIGIVAAMTLPQLINGYKAKVYEVGFKKAYSNLSKAIITLRDDAGMSNLNSYYAKYDPEKGYTNGGEFVKLFYKQLGAVEIAKPYKILNYNASVLIDPNDCTYLNGCPRPLRILPDGSSVRTDITSSQIFFDIDTNGPLKGPNRYGFDVFTFVLDAKDRLVPIKQSKLYTEEELKNEHWAGVIGNPCSIKSNQKSNGVGCAWYAINDISPEDETKSYWKNLP